MRQLSECRVFPSSLIVVLGSCLSKSTSFINPVSPHLCNSHWHSAMNGKNMLILLLEFSSSWLHAKKSLQSIEKNLELLRNWYPTIWYPSQNALYSKPLFATTARALGVCKKYAFTKRKGSSQTEIILELIADQRWRLFQLPLRLLISKSCLPCYCFIPHPLEGRHQLWLKLEYFKLVKYNFHSWESSQMLFARKIGGISNFQITPIYRRFLIIPLCHS